MPGRVVVNTTPFLALGACNQIDLLRLLYDRVVIPEEVRRELSLGGATALPTGLTTAHLEWVEVQPLSNPPSTVLLGKLDPGEAEVIALALELGFERVVMDERKGRRLAADHGLEVIGSLGILLKAKGARLLPAVKPCIDAMTSQGIWIESALAALVVRKAGE
jgi:predicted nucleic acid-binding protein